MSAGYVLTQTNVLMLPWPTAQALTDSELFEEAIANVDTFVDEREQELFQPIDYLLA